MSQKKGKFISFSGLEGVGKATIIGLVSNSLQDSGVKHNITEQPSTSGNSYYIKKMLKERDHKFSDNSNLCLMTAARKEVIDYLIEPTLERGVHVLTHTWLPDCRAYYDYKLAGELHKLICDDLTPDLQIILDAPAKVCIQRIENRKGRSPYHKQSMCEEESMEGVRSMFMRQVFEPGVVVIDAYQDKQFVFNSVMKLVNELIMDKGV